MPGTLHVDGVDLRDQVNLHIESDLQGWRNSLSRQIRARGRPGRIGEIMVASEVAAEARSLRVRGWQSAPESTPTVDALLALRDELLWRLDKTEAPVEVQFSDDLDRRFLARLDGAVQVEAIRPAMVQPRHRVSMTLRCLDPRAYAVTETSVTVGEADGDVDLPLGNAPVGPTVEVNLADFTLTYKDASGTVQGTLTVAGASATPVTVDMEARTIVTSNGGEIDKLDASTDFFLLDPQHGDPYAATPAWPTLALTDDAGSGTAGEATVTYRKAYL